MLCSCKLVMAPLESSSWQLAPIISGRNEGECVVSEHRTTIKWEILFEYKRKARVFVDRLLYLVPQITKGLQGASGGKEVNQPGRK